jgi:hypothetical protein
LFCQRLFKRPIQLSSHLLTRKANPSKFTLQANELRQTLAG